MSNTGTYPPFLYVPAALALAVMQAVHQTPYRAFLAERCANALAYSLLGFAALLLATRGKLLLFAVLLLPTALWLGGTLHPDGPMIGLSALAVALLTGAETSPKRLWLAAGAISLVILARPPLLPLGLLVALPLGPRRSAGPLLLAVLPGLLWMLVVIPHVAVPFYFAASYHGGPLWSGDPARLFHGTETAIQARTLLSHPGRLFTVPLATIIDSGLLRISDLFTGLGTLNLLLPALFTILGATALLGAVLGFGHDHARGRAPWIATAIAAAVVLIYDAEYINWTHVGSLLVEGVQGRYLLEMPLFLALAGAAKPARAIFAVPALGLATCSLVGVPLLVMAAYHAK